MEGRGFSNGTREAPRQEVCEHFWKKNWKSYPQKSSGNTSGNGSGRVEQVNRSGSPLEINAGTTDIELAVLVSKALEDAHITATLVGGAAVSIHSKNEYKSMDLDFATAAMRESLVAALEPLGFELARDKRHFVHPGTEYFVEFPPSPLEFGNRIVQHDEIPRLETEWGSLRVITPTLCVMDRLSAFWHWNDRPSWDQALMVVRHSEVDFDDLERFAQEEGADLGDIGKLRSAAER